MAEHYFGKVEIQVRFLLGAVQPTGIEPVSMVLQTTAMTTSARVAIGTS